jgi:hypothetical protein
MCRASVPNNIKDFFKVSWILVGKKTDKELLESYK